MRFRVDGLDRFGIPGSAGPQFEAAVREVCVTFQLVGAVFPCGNPAVL